MPIRVGLNLDIENWKGRWIQIWSGRSNHEPHIEAPLRVTARCEKG